MVKTMTQFAAAASDNTIQSRGRVSDILERTALRDDFIAVEREMLERISSRSEVLHDAGVYTVRAGGKRLRVLLVLLAARMGRYDFTRAVHPAVAIELLHAASLIHDDLVDHATSRRGQATIHHTWDRNVALALGDFLFGLAARELAHEPDPRIIGFYVHAAQRMVEGELHPVTQILPFEAATAQYFRKISAKTAVLFEAACKSGIAVCGGDERIIAALGTFGHELGMAFQIVDDILDMTAAASILGKPVGNDLREGTITLPLIHAVQRSSDPRLRTLVVGPVPDEDIAPLIELIVDAGGIEASYGTARECIERALAAIEPFADPLIYRALTDVTTIVLHRRS
jgi:heptaprenyl diphosphate synthase/octaprenyl-diphosphate synthase